MSSSHIWHSYKGQKVWLVVGTLYGTNIVDTIELASFIQSSDLALMVYYERKFIDVFQESSIHVSIYIMMRMAKPSIHPTLAY